MLLDSGRGAGMAPGEFRTTQNWIGGTRPGNVRGYIEHGFAKVSLDRVSCCNPESVREEPDTLKRPAHLQVKPLAILGGRIGSQLRCDSKASTAHAFRGNCRDVPHAAFQY